jgi:CRP-like cAMP-binding protein
MVESVTAGGSDFAWQKSPLFRFCEAADWEIFLSYVSVAEKPAGSVLWTEGEQSCQLICVVSGSLEAVKNTPDWSKPIIMAQYHPGASVGELVFGDDCEHSTSLQVVEKASLLILDKSQAESLQQNAPVTVTRLLHGAACLQLKRLRLVNRRLATLF